MTRNELMRRLEVVQSNPFFAGKQDIITFTGFLSDEELVGYVEQREAIVKKYAA